MTVLDTRDRGRTAPRTNRLRRLMLVGVNVLSLCSCARTTTLSAGRHWSGERAALQSCSKSATLGMPADSLFSRMRRALTKERVTPYAIDPRGRRIVIGGEEAPAFRGSGSLRRSRVLIEMTVDTSDVPADSARWVVVEGASLLADMSSRDSTRAREQASGVARRLMQSVDPRARGCWIDR